MKPEPRTWGDLKEVELAGIDDGPASEKEFCWEPGPHLIDLHQTKLSIYLKQYRLSNHLRQLIPALGDGKGIEPTPFWRQAFRAGRSILCARHHDQETDIRTSYETMWYLFLHARRMQEAIHRSLFLDLTPKLLKYGKLRSILPWSELSEFGDEYQKSLPKHLSALLDFGKEEAKSQGIENPDHRQIISWGMVRASRHQTRDRHVELDEKKTLAYFLFSDDDFLGVDPKFYELIREKAAQTIQRRLRLDVSQDDFEKWLLGGKDSFIGQIAKLKVVREIGGSETRRLVRKVFLKLGLEAHQYVAECIQLFAMDVANCIVPRLNEREAEIHSALFYGQSYLAGSSLLLLADKMHFLEGIYWPLASDPSPQTVEILHFAMQSYGTIVRDLQEIERHRKRRTVESDHSATDALTSSSNRFENGGKVDRMFEELRRLRNCRCHCLTSVPDWRNSFEETDAANWRLECECENCGFKFGPFEMTAEELRRFFDSTE